MLKIIVILLLILLLPILHRKGLIVERFNDTNKKSPFPIDIVYTWAGEKKTDDIRSSNNNELKYSIISVLKYLPWVNHIYILMNPPKKRPSWMAEELDNIITIVDQRDTFPEGYELPNKNSNAIETTLHNIKGLTEHFIYFNDDLFIGKPLEYTYFFTQDGKAIVSHLCLQSTKMLQEGKENKLNIKYPDMVQNFYNHVPISLLKSSLIEYQQEYPDYIDFVRKNTTRSGLGCDVCGENNLKCPCQQQHFIIARYMYEQDKAILKEYDIGSNCSKQGYINSSCIDYLDDIIENPPNTFIIQDTESDIEKRKEIGKKIQQFFKKFYGNNL